MSADRNSLSAILLSLRPTALPDPVTQLKSKSPPLTTDTTIGVLAERTRTASKKALPALASVLAVWVSYEILAGRPGAWACALICFGTCFSLAIWNISSIGLPVLPALLGQNLLVYGLPLAVGKEYLNTYPERTLVDAGVEVLVFDLAMVLAWKIGMRVFRPSQPVCYALREFNKGGLAGWSKLGMVIIVVTDVLQTLERANLMGGLYDILPSGATSILGALYAAATSCGFFLVSASAGRTNATVLGRATFWALLVISCLVSSSEFLLYGAAASLFTVAIGFFWSRGRIPWAYLISVSLILSFFNSGKTEIRARYWNNQDEATMSVPISKMPDVYLEWIRLSYNAVTMGSPSGEEDTISVGPKRDEGQALTSRIDNIQNLLFVIDAVESDHIRTLDGATYAIIPRLLVPRVLWPDKPRTHEGQIMLNVHFGRQGLEDTLSTYIAWGLLPEAYGNFGPILGALLLGGFLGVFCAWLENFSKNKLVMSVEGFMSLSLLISIMNSFEMVASVLVTSIFQSMMIILAASLPFVQRTVGKRRSELEEADHT